ncbi:MAG: hypothetical protein IJU65_06715 [Desulfovibrio sp.]|nr:hypothetical protein [Desulfovibrio sp.]
MKLKPRKNNPYCFSKRLENVLTDIPAYGLTVIEAPSGFGKTTALREYLTREHARADVRWYTCFGESTGKAWAGISKLFGGSEDSIVEELSELGEPTPENLAALASLISSYSCPEQKFLVIDNYQLFNSPVRKHCIAAFSACRDANLHIIVVTQPLKEEGGGLTFHPQPYLSITARDLFFDNACIAEYCRLTGITISHEKIASIQMISRGWVAAIRLQLQHYGHTGSLTDFSDIRPLVETAIWNRLSREERNLMMGLSLLDAFNTRQVAILSDGMALPDTVAELLSQDFFIRHVADRQAYVMHSILQDYLRERFSMETAAFRNSMYRKAALASLENGDLFQAALFFMEVEDYRAILSLPMSTQYVYDNQERNITSLFERLMDKCPLEILQEYPVFLVLMAYNFFRRGSRTYFLRATDFLRNLLENSSAGQGPSWERACGEYAMLMSFTEYNDIARMGAFHSRALQHLQAVSDNPRSEVFRGTMPFGTASVLCLYWNRIGGLSQLLDLMDTYLPVYSDLASGHGAGAEHIFRAEAALASGDDMTAELMAHKATYRGRNAGQYGVCLSADLILAEIGLLRGDIETYETARESLARNAHESGQHSVLRLGELCQAELDLSMGRTEDIPSWLRDAAGIQRVVYAHSIPYALIFHEHYLLLEGRYTELHGLEELIMQQANTMNYILPRLYYAIYLAIAEAKEGAMVRAIPHMEEALRLALPDKMYLPFARLAPDLKPIFPHLSKPVPKELQAICSRREKGVLAILRNDATEVSLLTPREQEVGVLAQERRTAKEISERLCISVHTVNTILKTVYRKYHISGKAELENIKLR